MGATLALLIVVVNGIVTDRGETVLARLGEWPLLGQVNVTAEALAAGAVIGLRAAVVMIALARLLRLRQSRPGAAGPAPARPALGADRDADLADGAAGGRRRLPACARRRRCAGREQRRSGGGRWRGGFSPAPSTGPSTSPPTLELRGYGLDRPMARPARALATTAAYSTAVC